MRARLPYLIVAAVCAVLVAFIGPADTSAVESSGTSDAGSSQATEAPQPLIPVVILSSVPRRAAWAADPVVPLRTSTAPDGARLFLAGLVLVSLAAAAKRG